MKQITSSRNWTRVIDFLSYEDNRYAKRASQSSKLNEDVYNSPFGYALKKSIHIFLLFPNSKKSRVVRVL